MQRETTSDLHFQLSLNKNEMHLWLTAQPYFKSLIVFIGVSNCFDSAGAYSAGILLSGYTNISIYFLKSDCQNVPLHLPPALAPKMPNVDATPFSDCMFNFDFGCKRKWFQRKIPLRFANNRLLGTSAFTEHNAPSAQWNPAVYLFLYLFIFCLQLIQLVEWRSACETDHSDWLLVAANDCTRREAAVMTESN